MKATERESEELVSGASVANLARSGSLPGEEDIREEYRNELIRKFSSHFDIDETDIRSFVKENE